MTYLCAENNFLKNKNDHMKVTVVGAGAVGATCADNIARKELCYLFVKLNYY